MMITVSQLVILFCIITFIIAHITATYLYKETYNTQKIKVSNLNLAWKIIANRSSYPAWWGKFAKMDSAVSSVNVLESSPNVFLKLMLKNPKTTDNELWTFYFEKINGEKFIIIKINSN